MCIEASHPSQQYFGHVGTESLLPGYYQYFWEVKYLAQGHNKMVVGFELPTSRFRVRCSTTEPRALLKLKSLNKEN